MRAWGHAGGREIQTRPEVELINDPERTGSTQEPTAGVTVTSMQHSPLHRISCRRGGGAPVGSLHPPHLPAHLGAGRARVSNRDNRDRFTTAVDGAARNRQPFFPFPSARRGAAAAAGVPDPDQARGLGRLRSLSSPQDPDLIGRAACCVPTPEACKQQIGTLCCWCRDHMPHGPLSSRAEDTTASPLPALASARRRTFNKSPCRFSDQNLGWCRARAARRIDCLSRRCAPIVAPRTGL